LLSTHLGGEGCFSVPHVYSEMCTNGILVTDYCSNSVTIDAVADILNQNERNSIAKGIVRLALSELFVWNFCQTDPNWGNFLYSPATKTVHLIDFGACRSYDTKFVDGYLRIVWANANRNKDELMERSLDMGFLTGEECDVMNEAHVAAGFLLGEPFAAVADVDSHTDNNNNNHNVYDFAKSKITARMSEHGETFLKHRLTPPPEEVYTLHRKLVGAFNLCIKLGAKIHCRDLLEDIMKGHVFQDGLDHPLLSSTTVDAPPSSSSLSSS